MAGVGAVAGGTVVWGPGVGGGEAVGTAGPGAADGNGGGTTPPPGTGPSGVVVVSVAAPGVGSAGTSPTDVGDVGVVVVVGVVGRVVVGAGGRCWTSVRGAQV